MRRARSLAAALVLAAAALIPATAHAEIIDFDPRSDDVPDILSEEEMALWEALRGRTNGVGVSDMSPDGSYAILNVGGAPMVMDTSTQEMRDYILGDWSASGSLMWTGDTTAVSYGLRTENGQTVEVGKLTIDFASLEYEVAPFPFPTMEGKQIIAYGGAPLWQDAQGDVRMLAYTRSVSGPLEAIDALEDGAPPTYRYDSRSIDQLADTGDLPMPEVVSQSPELLLAMSLEDGSVAEVGELPPGRSLSGFVTSASGQPGGNRVAFVTSGSYPWTGETINGRGSRGGGMPTGYFNVQENLGRIPAEVNPYVTETQLRVVDIIEGETVLVENADNLGNSLSRFADTLWTADGEHLLVVSQIPALLEGREHPIYEYNAGLELLRFSPEGRYQATWRREGMDTSNIGVSALEGTRLLMLSPNNTSRRVSIVDAADPGAEPTTLYEGPDMLLSYAYGSGSFAAALENAGSPREIYLSTSQTGSDFRDFEAVTAVNAELAAVGDIKTESFTFTSSSGYELTGTYVYPGDRSYPPAEPQPLVVWQQGGPGGQMYNMRGTSVESPYSLLPNFGIPVMILNGAGRMSNGAQFYADMADGRNYGQRDIQEVKEGVEHLIEQGVADAERIGVTGCSYGGYFTLQSLVEHPDFYAAGNSQCSLNDMMYEYNFGWSPFLAYLIGSSPTGDPAEYLKDSPTYRAGQIRTPLLQFHGTNDFLFFEHITNIHDQVEANGVPSRFFRARGYGHGLGGAQGDNSGMGQRYAFQLQLQWFREHLGVEASVLQRMDDLLAPITRRLLPQRPIGGGVR